jgi:glycosyltransferase involved in cell wall biosynthesis
VSCLPVPPDPIRLSIVIAAYNAQATLQRAIASCLTQRVDEPFEVLVVDDGSTDSTAAVARSFGPEVQVLSSDGNRGRSAARNAAIAAARGSVIVPLDADDRMLTGRLAAHVAALDGNPSAVAVFGRSIGVHPGGTRPWPLMPGTPQGVDEAFARGRMAVNHPACAFRRSWWEALGGYDEQVRVAEDFDLFLRGWTPGAYLPHDDVVLEYTISGRFPSWQYWWANERHRRAIVARAGDPAQPFVDHLHRASRPALHGLEVLRWSASSVRDRMARRNGR